MQNIIAVQQSVLVLVALAACVFAGEVQDQETAEQFYRINGFYPSWYNSALYPAYAGLRSYPYPYAAGSYYPYTGLTYPTVAVKGTPAATVGTKTAITYPWGSPFGYPGVNYY